jgi:hypothetical protein
MAGELKPTEPTAKHAHLELEYAQINDNFRFLADVRFKLLAFLPTLGGIAVFVLSGIGLQAGESSAPAAPERLVVVLLVSLLGFLATLGIHAVRPAQFGAVQRADPPGEAPRSAARRAGCAGRAEASKSGVDSSAKGRKSRGI